MITWENYKEDLALTISATPDLEKLNDAKFFITGATGLIGSYLVDMLGYDQMNSGRSYTIYAMSRSKEKLENRFPDFVNQPWFHPIIQDVSCFSGENIDADYIINCASNAHPALYARDPVGTITTNVWGTYHLLEYAREHHTKRMLQLSSVEIYGENRGDVEKFNEAYCGELNCNTARGGYPESKRVAETLCHSFHQAYGVDVVIARPCRIYGPTMEMNDSKASAQFIKKILNGEDIVLKSAGNQLFSYAYVADVVSALLLLLIRGEADEPYNIADKNSVIRLRDFAKLAAEIGGKSVRIEMPSQVELQGFSGAVTSVLDSSKLESLGWSAVTQMPEGIRKTISILRSVI